MPDGELHFFVTQTMEISQEQIDKAAKDWLRKAKIRINNDHSTAFIVGFEEGVEWVLKQINDGKL